MCEAARASDTRRATEKFDPDAYNKLRAERNEAANAKDWARFRDIRRQLDYELSKPGDQALKDAVLRNATKESWAVLKADIRKEFMAVCDAAKAAWQGFYEEFERGYEQARRERERQSRRKSHTREQKSSSGRQSSSDKLNSFERMWGRPPHVTLGIQHDASLTEIKRAWADAISKYHPDRVNQADASAVRIATQRAKVINMARAEMEHAGSKRWHRATSCSLPILLFVR